jgi:4a-hydroxytetrahydrobiopterin dehydratase
MPLSATEIQEALVEYPDWKLEDGSLVRNFTFGDFRESMSFVNSIAAVAEREGHHPDIDIRYNKVRLAAASHDAGGITDKDFSLLAAITRVL